MNKGRVFIISGPSGSGKDTVLKKVFAQCPQISFSISSITRPMREGEIEGEKYNFVSREHFEQMIKCGQLLEYNLFLGNYYGTPKEPVINCIESGKDIIIEVDVNGAEQIRNKIPDAVSIFIMPPSLVVLKNRLSARGTEKADVIEKRLNEALSEIKKASCYDYIVVNDMLDEAVDDVMHIITADRFKTDRNINIINKVLGK